MAERVRKLAGRMRWALRQRGVLGAARMMLGGLRQGTAAAAKVHPFDVEHGVETSGLIGGAELPGGHAHDVFSTAYFGVPPSRFRGLLERWRRTEGVRPVEQYAFLDVGCGKGRALLLAAETPFREVVGVELNPELAAVARINVARWSELGRTRCAARVECGDATEMKLPSGPLLVYLYNPFRAEVLRRLLTRLDGWAGENEGGLDLLYLYPEEEAVFAEFPGFRRMWQEGIPLGAEDVGRDEISSAEDPCSAYRWVG
ncbi:MAG: hypothetical protein NVSMB3_13900 [Acidobacteriaceae bacterium]